MREYTINADGVNYTIRTTTHDDHEFCCANGRVMGAACWYLEEKRGAFECLLFRAKLDAGEGFVRRCAACRGVIGDDGE